MLCVGMVGLNWHHAQVGGEDTAASGSCAEGVVSDGSDLAGFFFGHDFALDYVFHLEPFNSASFYLRVEFLVGVGDLLHLKF